MPDEFHYDVFLSHSSKDKALVRDIAERLRIDGLKVWFDEWEIKPGDSIPAKIEEGLEHSCVLVLCMSANAFGSDWAQLESYTFRFRDPLNRAKRFVPLRLDGSPVKGSLAQFRYINWIPTGLENPYSMLLEACRISTDWPPASDPQKEAKSDYTLRITTTRINEWKRLLADFEHEARQYHDAKLSIFYATQEEPMAGRKFPSPHYEINLWQYYGSTGSKETMERLKSLKLTKFGAKGAELGAYGLITGQKTDLFCKMAARAGSLLPDKINKIISDQLFEMLKEMKEPGKPILMTNSNSLAKWINLVLLVTATSHPERFRNGLVAADPFAASITVLDYFKLGQ